MILIMQQGPLHRTKLVENGKRQRKNWSSCHAVLTDTFLLFFKDAKTFAAMQAWSPCYSHVFMLHVQETMAMKRIFHFYHLLDKYKESPDITRMHAPFQQVPLK